jgi:hypothetical protein
MDRAEEEAGPKDVGEQALMRGLDTAFPFFRLGLSWSSVGRRTDDRPHNGFPRLMSLSPWLGLWCELEVKEADHKGKKANVLEENPTADPIGLRRIVIGNATGSAKVNIGALYPEE